MTASFSPRQTGHWSLYFLSIVTLLACASSVNGFTGPLQARHLGTRHADRHDLTTTMLYASSIGAKRPKKKKQKKSTKSTGQTLDEDQLRQHVSTKYMTPKRRTRTRTILGPDATQSQVLGKLDRHPALVLNADYQPISYLPLSMWHWQEAIKSVFSGKVTVVDTYPDVYVRAVSVTVPCPSVIALNEYVPQPNSRPAFTKKNVFLRDEYKCQYCSDRFATRDLSLDHVVPRCRGGRLTWENVATSCRKCNGRKGSLTVPELRHVGMKLLREPYCPTSFQLHKVAGRMLPKKVHPTWEPFLGMANKDLAENYVVAEDVHFER